MFHSDRGTLLFSYNWNEETQEDKTLNVNDLLISGGLQGMRQIIQSVLKTGEITYIQTENACILINKLENHPIIFTLTTDKFSHALHNALDVFSSKFEEKYSQYFDNPTEVSNFEGANTLVEDILYFLPKQKKS